MFKLVFFMAVMVVILLIIIRNNIVSIRTYVSSLWKPKDKSKVFKKSKEYSFKEGMAKLGNIPDVTPKNWSFIEEVNEHIRNCRK